MEQSPFWEANSCSAEQQSLLHIMESTASSCASGHAIGASTASDECTPHLELY